MQHIAAGQQMCKRGLGLGFFPIVGRRESLATRRERIYIFMYIYMHVGQAKSIKARGNDDGDDSICVVRDMFVCLYGRVRARQTSERANERDRTSERTNGRSKTSVV